MRLAAIVLLGVAAAGAMGGAETARAAPLNGGAGLAASEPRPLEPARYYWDGRSYCWYFDGWRGPGWYRCGYPWRRGYGWGGGYGWRGWDVPGWHGDRRYYGPRHDHWHDRHWRGDDHRRRRDWDDRDHRRHDRGDGDRGRRGEWRGEGRTEWR